MEQKAKFEPCEVSIVAFDGRKDLITTSGAHDAPEIWLDAPEDSLEEKNDIYGDNE